MISRDVDYVVIGNGLGALITLRSLLHSDYSAVLLCPEERFFIEDSELDFSPVLDFANPEPEDFVDLDLEQIRAELSADYPGPFNIGPDEIARKRRLWIEGREDFAVSAAAAGARIVESGKKGYQLLDFYELDARQYRSEVLQFMLERFGDRVRTLPDGVRLEPTRAIAGEEIFRPGRGVLFAWTPRMERWLHAQRLGMIELSPVCHLWEEWFLSPNTPQVDDQMQWRQGFWTSWVRTTQGDPLFQVRKRKVVATETRNEHVFDPKVLEQLDRLLRGSLNWGDYRIRDYRNRFLIMSGYHSKEKRTGVEKLSGLSYPVYVYKADGPLFEVLRSRTDVLRSALENI